MSSRSTGGKRQTKMRGPSRPIDPRNAPGPTTQRRGIDTFGLALLGIISAVILGMVFLLAGQQQPTASVPTDPQSNPQQPGTGTVQYVQASEARTLVESGSAQVIDVRPAPNYGVMHIKGATSLPYTEAAQRVAEIPRTGTIILYCQ